MSFYINLGNGGFQTARNGEYVDKSKLISVVNSVLFTKRKFMCVSRCRRFGKSMAAKMLAAYYDKSCDSRHLFEDLAIAQDPSFEQHLNKYPVLYLDFSGFVSEFKTQTDIVGYVSRQLIDDVKSAYKSVDTTGAKSLLETLLCVSQQTGDRFVFIVDEWDAICREFDKQPEVMDRYVDWLRSMFKDVRANDVFALVYMTGILPIKRYQTQSALNNFTEYSMISPKNMASYFGFTKDEVRQLCQKFGMELSELEKWYDGYQMGDVSSIFNPNSVMQALYNQWCESYWATTGAYDTVSDYISMNYEGLKDDVVKMLGGGRCKVDTTKFSNDLWKVSSRDDVLTVLIHLGYLSYDRRSQECYVPNREVSGELANAVETTSWTNVVVALRQSEELLQATLAGDTETVAKGLETVHDNDTRILSYNNEESLSCAISIAYYYAKNDYVVHRELPTGKGFADLVFIPRKGVTSPALVIELKVNQTADSAIDQIKRKNYMGKVAEYTGDLLLVGISYDRETKQHTCQIESWRK